MTPLGHAAIALARKGMRVFPLAQLEQNRGHFSISQKSVRVRSRAYVAGSVDLSV